MRLPRTEGLPAAASLALAFVSFLALNAFVWAWRADLQRDRDANLLRVGRPPTGASVRYDWSTGESLGTYLPRVPDARRTRLVALAGMSQMYAINDRRREDQTISEHLDDLISPIGARAFGVAAPNLSNEEALFLFETLAASPKTKPAVFVYGVCFDKFRNVNLRPGYLALLTENSSISTRWESARSALATRFPVASGKMTATLTTARVAPSSSKTELSREGRIRNATAAVVPVVAARREVSSFLQMQLFLLRNWIFDIDPTSKRPILSSRYDLNWQFLEALAARARENDVTLVLYVIPLNPRSENPYVPEQYAQFKEKLESFCTAERIPFANLEDVVPSEHWGDFMGGPDFKHFRGEGHRLTAEAIYSSFRPVLLGEQ